jgi:hypothetical protein
MHTHQCVSQVHEQIGWICFRTISIDRGLFRSSVSHFVCGQLPLLFAPLRLALPISVACCLTSSHAPSFLVEKNRWLLPDIISRYCLGPDELLGLSH